VHKQFGGVLTPIAIRPSNKEVSMSTHYTCEQLDLNP
jgi:hypothetical protein